MLFRSNRGDFSGRLFFNSTKAFNLKFTDADVTMNNKKWEIDPGNSIAVDSSSFMFRSFTFSHESESVGIQGLISESSNDTLFFNARNFSLNDLNPLLSKISLSAGGMLNGSASVSNIYNKPLLISNLSIHSFAVNEDTLGNAVIVSDYDTKKKAVHQIGRAHV